MSDRRAARGTGKIRTLAAGLMPAELMAGPCIEVWADRKPGPSSPSLRAWRAWQEAVDGWAVESGWAGDNRPAMHARKLARTGIPWSREYLIAHGNRAQVDYYEGRRSDG